MPTTLSPWWTISDAAVCASHESQDARDDMPEYDPDTATDAESEALDRWCASLHPLVEEYCCRRCTHWVSPDGERGLCLGRYCQAYEENEEAEPKASEEDGAFMDSYPPKVREYETRGDAMCEGFAPLIGD